ncbi:MAG: zf-HC2 domain-containing protein, partial [Ilumatobacter sp.]
QQYLDGHIDPDRARRIEAHLDECRRCGMEADTYERIKSTLAAQRPEVPAEAVDRLREFGERLARGEEPTPP